MVEYKRKSALVMFSGGYDSVAILHKAITKQDYNDICLVYEVSRSLQDEVEYKNTLKVIKWFKRKFKNVTFELVEIEESLSWLKYDNTLNQRDFLLDLHLSNAIKNFEHHHEVILLGWKRSNVKSLNIAKEKLKMLEENIQEDVKIEFLEDWFGESEDGTTKQYVIEYLLENNIFHLPMTGHNKTKKEYKERTHWHVNDPKMNEVAISLVATQLFDAIDIQKIFSFKTTKEVQEWYNQRSNKSD